MQNILSGNGYLTGSPRLSQLFCSMCYSNIKRNDISCQLRTLCRIWDKINGYIITDAQQQLTYSREEYLTRAYVVDKNLNEA